MSIKPKQITGIFPCYIAKVLPLAFDESMSYYECLCAMLKYLNEQVVPEFNTAIESFNELQEFVDHYFDNLDVQEEINNKLDQMAESGELDQIIEQYLNSSAIWGFDTVAEMKTASNLINGSYARTLGYYTKNDGGNGLYKIREITNSDVVDNAKIIALEDSDLIAELIITEYITPEQFGCYGDNTHDDTTNLQKAIDSGINIVANNTYSISSVYIHDIVFNLGGIINGQVKIGRKATLTGGQVHAKTLNPTIEIVNNVVNPKSLNSIVDNVDIYPTNDGIGIYVNATEYSLFDFVVQNCNINSGNIGLKFENANSHFITKCSFENVYLNSPNTGIKIINTGYLVTMSDIVFRNVYAQYYNHKPNYFIDADLTRIYLYDSFCYDGIETAIYNITNNGSRIIINEPFGVSAKTFSENTDQRIFVINQLSDPDGGHVLRASRDIKYLPVIRNGLIDPVVSGTSGLALQGYPFLGFIGHVGTNILDGAKYSAIGFNNGRLGVGYSDTTTPGDFKMVEVSTPFSGAVYTSDALPTVVRNGAKCWCSDLLMDLTYYNYHWYKPDGTQFN